MVLKCHHNLVASFMAPESGGPNLQNAGKKVGEQESDAWFICCAFVFEESYIHLFPGHLSGKAAFGVASHMELRL